MPSRSAFSPNYIISLKNWWNSVSNARTTSVSVKWKESMMNMQRGKKKYRLRLWAKMRILCIIIICVGNWSMRTIWRSAGGKLKLSTLMIFIWSSTSAVIFEFICHLFKHNNWSNTIALKLFRPSKLQLHNKRSKIFRILQLWLILITDKYMNYPEDSSDLSSAGQSAELEH